MNEYSAELAWLGEHPEVFFSKVLASDCEEYQVRALKLICENERVAISACHDLGKSWLLGRVVPWFMCCFPRCKVITTAPTYNQVKNILWAEIRSAYARAAIPLGGKMNLTEWQMTPNGDWFAIGFTPRNEVSGDGGQGTQSSFQGFHAEHVLVIFDEATGIPHNIWTMAEGMLTSGHVKFVAIGNPTSRSSEFYKCFSSPDWAKLKLSCFDSPNLIANGITDLDLLQKEIDYVRGLSDTECFERLKGYKVVKDYLLSLKWVVSMGLPRKWGTTHPLFVSKVLGQFPKDVDGTLIPLGVVEDAQLRIAGPQNGERKTIGVDVARFGGDSTILTALHGKQYKKKKQLVKKDTNEVVGEIINMCREDGPFDIVVVDETGIGGGVVDVLRAACREHVNADLLGRMEVRGVQFGAACESPLDKEKFVNVKARMFRLLADDLASSEGITLAQDDVYADELPTIRYGYDQKGRMFIESKDEYKKRTGRKSPDDSDSLALANYGRYDDLTVGTFGQEYNQGYARPFAESLGANRPFAAGLGKGKRW